MQIISQNVIKNIVICKYVIEIFLYLFVKLGVILQLPNELSTLALWGSKQRL